LAAHVVNLVTQYLVHLLKSRNFSLKRSGKRGCVSLPFTNAVALFWLRRVDAKQFCWLKTPLTVLVLVSADFALPNCS
jgi:hypothetical protein